MNMKMKRRRRGGEISTNRWWKESKSGVKGVWR